jgi:hypothetical protein
VSIIPGIENFAPDRHESVAECLSGFGLDLAQRCRHLIDKALGQRLPAL